MENKETEIIKDYRRKTEMAKRQRLVDSEVEVETNETIYKMDINQKAFRWTLEYLEDDDNPIKTEVEKAVNDGLYYVEIEQLCDYKKLGLRQLGFDLLEDGVCTRVSWRKVEHPFQLVSSLPEKVVVAIWAVSTLVASISLWINAFNNSSILPAIIGCLLYIPFFMRYKHIKRMLIRRSEIYWEEKRLSEFRADRKKHNRQVVSDMWHTPNLQLVQNQIPTGQEINIIQPRTNGYINLSGTYVSGQCGLITDISQATNLFNESEQASRNAQQTSNIHKKKKNETSDN